MIGDRLQKLPPSASCILVYFQRGIAYSKIFTGKIISFFLYGRLLTSEIDMTNPGTTNQKTGIFARSWCWIVRENRVQLQIVQTWGAKFKSVSFGAKYRASSTDFSSEKNNGRLSERLWRYFIYYWLWDYMVVACSRTLLISILLQENWDFYLLQHMPHFRSFHKSDAPKRLRKQASSDRSITQLKIENYGIGNAISWIT